MQDTEYDLAADKKKIRDLYNIHTQKGLPFRGGFARFESQITTYLDPVACLLLQILPSTPHHYKNFLNHLPPAARLQVNALAGLYNHKSPFRSPDHAAPHLPDIKIEENRGIILFSTFSRTLPALYDIAEGALDRFWQDFERRDIAAMTEATQRQLLQVVHDMDFDMHQHEKQHQKLVFGLRLPQDLLDFHRHGMSQLAARIITDENLYTGLNSFLSTTSTIPYNPAAAQTEAEKRRIVDLFMRSMAEIWQIPDPVSEDYKKEPAQDQNGQEFSELMHAFYRAAANDNNPTERIGLVYGVNTHKGYLHGERRYIVTALGHEFGHLLSNFIVSAHKNHTLIEGQARKNDIRKAAILSLRAAGVLGANNAYDINGRYYGQINTAFAETLAGTKTYAYKGQLEERHADWFGQTVMEYIDLALRVKNHVIHEGRLRLYCAAEFTKMMRQSPVRRKNPELFNALNTSIQTSTTSAQLQNAMAQSFDRLQHWLEQYYNNIAEPPSHQRAQMRHVMNSLDTLRKETAMLFEIRTAIVDGEPDAPENTLTHG